MWIAPTGYVRVPAHFLTHCLLTARAVRVLRGREGRPSAGLDLRLLAGKTVSPL